MGSCFVHRGQSLSRLFPAKVKFIENAIKNGKEREKAQVVGKYNKHRKKSGETIYIHKEKEKRQRQTKTGSKEKFVSRQTGIRS